jgi:hypothetical protein
MTYGIEHVAEATGELTLRWNGGELGGCDASLTAPCVEKTADGAVAHVVGAGVIEVSAGGKKAATLTAKGGKAGRKVGWVIRR